MAKKPTKEQAMAKSNVIQSWKDIRGQMKVWARAWDNGKKGMYITYSTNVSKKVTDDDDYSHLFYDVIFKKGTSPEFEATAEGFKINILAGFLTLRVTSTGEIRPAVMVMDYEIVEE